MPATGFLFHEGYSLLRTGWKGDVLPGEDGRQIELPIATEQGAPITGPVAAELVVRQWTRSAPFTWGNSRGYRPVSLDPPDASSDMLSLPPSAHSLARICHFGLARKPRNMQ